MNEVKAKLSKAHFTRVIILTSMFYAQLQNTIVRSKTRKKKVFLRKAALRTHTLKLYNFRMLINMSIVVLQVPDTLYLLATCTFSKYSKVDSVVIGWRLWNMCSHGSLGEIINFMLHIQLRLLFSPKAALMGNRNWLDSKVVSCWCLWKIVWM